MNRVLKSIELRPGAIRLVFEPVPGTPLINALDIPAEINVGRAKMPGVEAFLENLFSGWKQTFDLPPSATRGDVLLRLFPGVELPMPGGKK